MAKNRDNMGGPTENQRTEEHQKGEERSRGHGEGGLTIPDDVARTHKAESSGKLFESQHTAKKEDLKRKHEVRKNDEE
ncbi:MAG: hypothetical protein WBX15_12685 [Thermoanaerobaculia bacterium]